MPLKLIMKPFALDLIEHVIEPVLPAELVDDELFDLMLTQLGDLLSVGRWVMQA